MLKTLNVNPKKECLTNLDFNLFLLIKLIYFNFEENLFTKHFLFF